MERYLIALGTIAAAGPRLGLFGTVVGRIQMFLGIMDYGVGDVNELADGIGKALVCTATGMIVAVPVLLFNRHFRTRIDRYLVALDHTAMKPLHAIEHRSCRPQSESQPLPPTTHHPPTHPRQHAATPTHPEPP